MEQKKICFYSISANRCNQKDWFLWKNMHLSMSTNWENSSCMLQSTPKYFISIELNKSFTVVKSVHFNKTVVQSTFLSKVLSFLLTWFWFQQKLHHFLKWTDLTHLKENMYWIVASTNMCYYSENEIFWFLNSRIVTSRNFFLGKKLFCLLSKWAEKKILDKHIII